MPTCDILAQGLLAVHMVAVGLVFSILLDEALHTLFEVVDGRVFPPLMQVTVFVVLATLIVERMRQFVPHHNAHCAVVQRLRIMNIVEWRLQDAGREDDLVFRWRIVGVHRWRRHLPFRFEEIPFEEEKCPFSFLVLVRLQLANCQDEFYQ